MPTAEGQRIPARCQGVLYSVQTLKGTPVTPATSPGIIESADLTDESGNEVIYGLGSGAIVIAEGVNVVNWSIRIRALQTKAFLAAAIAKVYGELPWLTLGFGYRLDGAAPVQKVFQVQDCKVGQFTFTHKGPGMAQLDVSGKGGLIAAGSSFAPANLTDKPFNTYEGVLTRGGAAHKALGVSFSVDYSLEEDYPIPGAAPATFVRGWDDMVEGYEKISGEIERKTYTGTGTDLQAATQTAADIVYVLTSKADPGNTMTLTFTGTKIKSRKHALGDPYTVTEAFDALAWSVA